MAKTGQPRFIDAVSFDVDGTLYALRGLAVRFALRHPLLLPVAWALGRAREGLRREAVARADLLPELDRRTAALLRCTPARAAAARERLLEQAWPDALRQLGPAPGARALLDGLVRRGVRLAALSDHPAAAKLEALGLGDLPWAACIDGSALGALKPLPAPFHAVLQAVGLPAGRVLHVGDRPDADVEGALGVGMRAALLLPESRPDARPRRGSAPAPGRADGLAPLVCRGFAELQRQLAPLLGEEP